LVVNRDAVVERIQYRIQDLDIQAKHALNEANEAIRLLEVIDRPRALLAGQLSTKEGTPAIDASALDKLVESDYVGPVVERISMLQRQIQIIEAERTRLEKRLAWLSRPALINPGALPTNYKEIASRLSLELSGLVQKHNRLLEEYLTETITSLVAIRQSPTITRPGYSPLFVLPAVAFLSIFFAVVVLSIERLAKKVVVQ
jgi:hypothetical protein